MEGRPPEQPRQPQPTQPDAAGQSVPAPPAPEQQVPGPPPAGEPAPPGRPAPPAQPVQPYGGQTPYGYYNPPAYGGYQQPQQPYFTPAGYMTFPIEPSNDAAVGALVASLASIAFLFLTGGIASPITLAGSIVGIIFGRKGMRNVDEGRTHKQRDMAQGGFITGIIGVVLSVLALAGWIALIVVAASSDGGGGGQLDSLGVLLGR